MLKIHFATLPFLLATALAQAPADTLNLQPLGSSTLLAHTPRAGWTAVTSAGTTSPAGTGTGYGTWRNATPATSDGNDAIYVFGGRKQSAGTSPYNDLYRFTPSTGTLTMLIGDGVAGSPPARQRHGAAWHPGFGRLYIYAGYGMPGGAANPSSAADCLSDIWEYDPGTNSWANVTPGGSNPIAREFAGLAYDPATTGLLMFGGSSGATGVWNDTWLFLPDPVVGQPGIWTQLVPTTTPPARQQHSLHTRFDYGDVVMDLGADSSVTSSQRRFCDVWQWNGADWVLLYDYNWAAASGTYPASVLGTYSCYDPLRKRILHAGGNGISSGLFTGTSGTAGCTPSNGDHIYLYFNTGTGFYEANNGSPVNWTSEFDVLSNSWQWYSRGAGNNITGFAANDPIIGRVSRNAVAFAPSTGKVYMLFGQNGAASGGKPTYNVYEYQANPIASTAPYGTGCTGPGSQLTLTETTAPWTGRSFDVTASGFGAFSLGFAMVSLGQVAPGVFPINPNLIGILPGPGVGCDLLIASLDIPGGLIPVAGSATYSLPLSTAEVDPSLPGLVFYLQVAELDFSAGWIGTYTTNGLTCTVGAL
jgi:hypothetical protein